MHRLIDMMNSNFLNRFLNILDKGQLYVCGDSTSGKLGIDENGNQFTPIQVEKYNLLNTKIVSCGGCHMILVATLKLQNQQIEKNSLIKNSPENSKIKTDRLISNYEDKKNIKETKIYGKAYKLFLKKSVVWLYIHKLVHN